MAESTVDWSKLTVVQLKTELESRGLSAIGRKQDLVMKLLEHDAERLNEADDKADGEEDGDAVVEMTGEEEEEVVTAEGDEADVAEEDAEQIATDAAAEEDEDPAVAEAEETGTEAAAAAEEENDGGGDGDTELTTEGQMKEADDDDNNDEINVPFVEEEGVEEEEEEDSDNKQPTEVTSTDAVTIEEIVLSDSDNAAAEDVTKPEVTEPEEEEEEEEGEEKEDDGDDMQGIDDMITLDVAELTDEEDMETEDSAAGQVETPTESKELAADKLPDAKKDGSQDSKAIKRKRSSVSTSNGAAAKKQFSLKIVSEEDIVVPGNFKHEIMHTSNHRRVSVYPVNMGALAHPSLQEAAKKCTSVRTCCRSNRDGVLVGWIQLEYRYMEDVHTASDQLSAIQPDVRVHRHTPGSRITADQLCAADDVDASMKPAHGFDKLKPENLLFVGNLPAKATEAELAALFAGSVVVSIIVDDDLQSKG